MEGIEISFPLTICRDIIEDTESELWRFYQASISTGKKDGKKTKGSLRTRVVSDETEQFVNLILTFPRHTIRCPAVRGKLRCRAEIIQSSSETDQSSESAPEKTQVAQRVSIADDRQRAGDKTKVVETAKTRDSEKGSKHITNTTSLASPETKHRPSRRREKPSKFKDYVAGDMPKHTDEGEEVGPQKTDSHCEAEAENVPVHNMQGSISGISNGHSEHKDCTNGNTSHQKKRKKMEVSPLSLPAQIPPKQTKRVVRKYDKLIKNLQQASAKTGLEMLSVISGLKSKVDSELGNTECSPEIMADSVQVDSALVQHSKTQSGADERNTADCPELCMPADASHEKPNNTSIPLATKSSAESNVFVQKNKKLIESKSLKKTVPNWPPHLTSFPRKFPSCLTRKSVGDSRKRPLQSTNPEGVNDILSKYKKIRPAEKLTNEEEYFDEDKDEDYVPSGEDSDSAEESLGMNTRRETKRQRKQPTSSQSGNKSGSVWTPQQQSSTEVTSSCAQQENKSSELCPVTQSADGDKVNTALVGSLHVVSPDQPVLLAGVQPATHDIINPSTSNTQVPDGQPHQGHHKTPNDNTENGATEKKTKPVAAPVADHDYANAVPAKKSFFSTKALKTLVKPISLARHISARVEKVEEGEGSSLVTISGQNTKAAKGWLRPSNLSLPLNHEGLPIANSMEDVMTDTIKSREKHLESYRLALSAETAPEVLVDVDATPAVVSEVVLTSSGYQATSHHTKMPQPTRGRPRKYPLLKPPVSLSSTAPEHPGSSEENCDMSGAEGLYNSEGNKDSNTIVIQMTKSGWKEVENMRKGETVPDEHRTGFLKQHVNENNTLEQEKASTVDTGQQQSKCDIVVENEADVNSSQQCSVSRLCRYCLRMFPTPMILYKHLRTVHSAYSKSPEYWEYRQVLRRDSRIVCPFCPGHHALSNEYKLRAHLANFHQSQIDDVGELVVNQVLPWCEVCQIQYHTLSELKAHATLLHNTDVFACPHCPQVFVRETTLSTHVKEAHSDLRPSPYLCKMCAIRFDSKRLFLTHRQAVHGKPPKRSTDEAVVTRVHRRLNTPPARKSAKQLGPAMKGVGQVKRIKCPCCPARFNSFWQMQGHQRKVHTGPIPVHCVICGAGYQSTAAMHNHLKHHLRSDAGEVTDSSVVGCLFCSMVMPASKAILVVTHLLDAHSERFPHVCHVCQQRFTAEEPLQIHLQQAHELIVVGSAQSDSPSGSVPSASHSEILTNAVKLDSADGRTISGSSVENTSVSPTPLDVSSDLFFSLPQKVQQSIQLINQQGKKAIITIDDGKGSVQKVCFRQSHTQSMFLPETPKFSSLSVYGAGDQEANLECSETGVEESTVVADPMEETRFAVENLVYDMSFAAETEVATEAELVESPGTVAEVVIENPGVVSEKTFYTDSETAEMEVVVPPNTDAGMEMDLNTNVITGTRGAAMEVRFVIENQDSDTQTERLPGPPGTGKQVVPEMSDAATYIQVDTETSSVITGAEIVSNISGTPNQVVIKEGEEVTSGDSAEGGSSVIDLSELSTVIVQTSDAETLTLTADDFLKFIKDSQTAGGTNSSASFLSK